MGLFCSIFNAMLVWLLLTTRASTYDMQWRTGRSTFYGGPTDPVSINHGACGFGYLYDDDPLGWDIAAMNDGNPLYEDSCGQCFEAKCDPRWIKDSYGGVFDRTTSCIDSSSSIIVRITDVCPCTYPPNFYSNKRWCCNDVEHLDMSIWAFEKIAPPAWGVIGLMYRQVPCNYIPDHVARDVSDPTPGNMRPDSNVRVTRDWPDMRGPRADSLFIYKSGHQNSFHDSSWSADLEDSTDSSKKGLHNGNALCANILPNGAVGFTGPNGSFSDRVSIQFFLYVGQTGYNGGSAVKPNIKISLAGSMGGCSPIRIYDVDPTYFEPANIPYGSDYYWGWQVYFPAFASDNIASVIINNPSSFTGCGGGNLPQDLNTVMFRNDANSAQHVCLDHIELS